MHVFVSVKSLCQRQAVCFEVFVTCVLYEQCECSVAVGGEQMCGLGFDAGG